MIKRRNTDGSSSNYKKWLIPLGFFLTILTSLLVLLYVSSNFRLQDTHIDNEPVLSFDQGWYYGNDTSGEAIPPLPCQLPFSADSTSVQISHPLPPSLPSDPTFCIKTNHQFLKAYLDGILIYQNDLNENVPFGRAFGSLWNLIPLSPKDAGKTMTLTIDSPYNMVSIPLYPMTLGSKSATVFHLIKLNYWSLIPCLLILIIGIAFLIVGFISIGKKYVIDYSSFLCLGSFSFMAALWILSDCQFLQFYCSNNAVIYLLSFFVFMLFPIPFLFFIKGICKHGGKFLSILSVLFIVSFFVQLFLYVSGIAELTQTIPFTHFLLVVSMIYVLRICFMEEKVYKNKNVREVNIGLCILCILSLCSLIYFYVGRRNNYSFFFCYGLLAFIVLLSIGTLKRSLLLFNESVEAKTYKRLAFTDLMTTLNNRAAFDQQMERYEREAKAGISLVLFDLDNLKESNDHYGHFVGDELIKGIALCVKEVFGSFGSCFRIGGDEFVVLMENGNDKIITSLLDQLHELVMLYNQKHKYGIDVSWGYAIQSGKCEYSENGSALFRAADQNMYANKAQNKAQRRLMTESTPQTNVLVNQ